MQNLLNDNQEEDTTVTGGGIGNITDAQLSGADKTLIFGNVNLEGGQSDYEFCNEFSELKPEEKQGKTDQRQNDKNKQLNLRLTSD